MAANPILPLTIYKLAEWDRVYTFPFGSSSPGGGFIEFNGSPTPTVVSQTITADPGITVGSPSVSGSTISVAISGGTVGQSYNILCEVTLSTGDVLSIPGIISVVEASTGVQGIFQQTLSKLPDWERHFQFPFGRVFAEFNVASPPSIVGTPTFTCQPATDGSTIDFDTPVVSGGTVVVFIHGGNAGMTYKVLCEVTLSTGTVLSIPGILSVTSPN